MEWLARHGQIIGRIVRRARAHHQRRETLVVGGQAGAQARVIVSVAQTGGDVAGDSFFKERNFLWINSESCRGGATNRLPVPRRSLRDEIEEPLRPPFSSIAIFITEQAFSWQAGKPAPRLRNLLVFSLVPCCELAQLKTWPQTAMAPRLGTFRISHSFPARTA